MRVNSLGEMMIATRHGNFPVKKGDKLAGTRIIPLVIEKEKMEEPLSRARMVRPRLRHIVQQRRRADALQRKARAARIGGAPDLFRQRRHRPAVAHRLRRRPKPGQ